MCALMLLDMVVSSLLVSQLCSSWQVAYVECVAVSKIII